MGDKKPKVLFVGAFHSPKGGEVRGGQLYACRAILNSPLSSYVSWRLLDTTMLSVPPPGLIRRSFHAFSRLVRFTAIICAERVDAVLIFASSGWSFIEKGAMACVARLAKKRVVFCPRSGLTMDDYHRSKIMRVLIPRFLRCCDVVVCQGRTWAEFYGSVSKLQADRLQIIGNCIVAQQYDSVALPSDRSPVRVLMMGWIERNKGVFDLVEVVDRYRKELATVQFVICGRGQDYDTLRRMIEERNLQNAFDLRGWVGEPEKQDLFETTDVFLMLSYREGQPNALLEAMSAGRAVLATTAGSIPEVIADGQTGFLCPPGDIDGIGSRLVELCTNPALRKVFGAAAQRAIRERHDCANVWRKWWAVLYPPPQGINEKS